ncbi:hypothetical protein FHR20_002256 [Sphingomonas leidyi]|uniref:Glycosyltransferase RgtA/B/C/D-like domain-containing protein n=1 Tax=Sphingomonas leidyi TaxID=68569 RepID=A0A7X5ZW01_9SPHN|nr:hypothetical protein [Sphingomonas leidyi]NIJ65294.1 hypothetical protein [Sphingomonas leidyi]
METSRPRYAWRDPGVALLLTVVLCGAWTLRDWHDLAALRLPDTDDMVRLQQIRDWLAGQSFGDLAQHRLGPVPGLEMHWSRLADLVPAAWIVALTPWLGGHGAALAAVILWPASLFCAALALTGAVARRLGAPPATATLLAALAYPATSLFLPGRIDHHGLQLVLILLLVRVLLGTGSFRAGAVAALAVTASLVIGLETLPLLGVAGAALVLLWVADRPGSRDRLLGFGFVLPIALAGAGILFRTSGWSVPACDGFTGLLWRAVQCAAIAPMGLALFAVAGPRTARARAGAAGIAGVAAAGAVLLLAPQCLDPYGEVDPLLARLWLAEVGEAQPLFGAPPANAIAYAGLALAGLIASLAIARRRREAGWWVVAALQFTALAITLFQLRGAYAGAMLAAPALAVTIGAARARGPFALVAAWIAATGILYPIAATAIFPPRAAAGPSCTTPESLARLAALPPGHLLAPLDLGAYALAATPHAVLAAPYHRNNPGNRAMYDFFLSQPAQSEAIARAWGIDYVAFCPDDLDRFAREARDPRSLAAGLRAGSIPDWLVPIDGGDAPRTYRLASRH